MKNFKTLVSESAEVHGHLCPGQIIGVRMAILCPRHCGKFCATVTIPPAKPEAYSI